jgi:hypothetical protein
VEPGRASRTGEAAKWVDLAAGLAIHDRQMTGLAAWMAGATTVCSDRRWGGCTVFRPTRLPDPISPHWHPRMCLALPGTLPSWMAQAPSNVLSLTVLRLNGLTVRADQAGQLGIWSRQADRTRSESERADWFRRRLGKGCWLAWSICDALIWIPLALPGTPGDCKNGAVVDGGRVGGGAGIPARFHDWLLSLAR